MKTYRPKLIRVIPILLLPLILLIPLFINGESLKENELFAVIGAVVLVFLIVVATLGWKIKVSSNEAKNYFFGFLITTMNRSNVKSVAYKNLFRGGLGVGKGLIIQLTTDKGRIKTISIGEKLYGKDAIEHIRNVLDDKNNIKN